MQNWRLKDLNPQQKFALYYLVKLSGILMFENTESDLMDNAQDVASYSDVFLFRSAIHYDRDISFDDFDSVIKMLKDGILVRDQLNP